ncbi:Arm DNA-binding domain-containing protein [Nitrosovibrio sp. Nv6]|uniref:Arm DNA-binding domain-containing protein n=1 Tax=Nitrosovibrio sp. Nv6 TaxID=1855340 RepID=UPI0018F2E533|nr:Arm DNA-binding domain-containing protein [Nitrosovibrio sp. Nv6]
MYLLVQPHRAKYWRLKYRFAGVEKVLALGVYPDVSLSGARERRESARKLLANNADPSAVKKAQKAASVALTENSFGLSLVSGLLNMLLIGLVHSQAR